ncbi:MAG: nucleoside phosphorylase, partial [Clostridiaceae bacterium]
MLLSEFDKDTIAILEPKFCVDKVDEFPKTCVSTFSQRLIDKFSKMDGVVRIGNLMSTNGAVPVYKIVYSGTPIGFFLSRVGAPACVMGFENAIAMGLKKLVLFGSCGVLNREIEDGHIVIPTSAVRDEGTSYHYLPPSDEVFLETQSVNAVEKTLKSLKYPYTKGKTWTTDAVYRETKSKAELRKKQGCIVVEMECSAMTAAAKFRNVKFAQFLYSADNLDCPEWERRG